MMPHKMKLDPSGELVRILTKPSGGICSVRFTPITLLIAISKKYAWEPQN